MQPKSLQFSLARLLAAVTAACGAFAVVRWLGTERAVYLGAWSLLLLIATLPIYGFALSIVTLTTSGGAVLRRRLLQAGLFPGCLPFGWLALLAANRLLFQ